MGKQVIQMTTPSDVELYKLMSPEEQEQYLDMLRDIAAVGPKPTRKQLLRALLPHLQAMFGDVVECQAGSKKAENEF